MRRMWIKFWGDERGSVPATEWMLVASILTLGVVAATLFWHGNDERVEDEPPALIR